jgi:hypothetical protein
MRFLRQNTAVIITVGPFYDKTDGVTIETALTITNERITLTADTDAGSAPTNILDNVTGATSATANDLNYITGNDAGMMQMELAAADTNRVGRMMLSITDAANHVPVFHEFFVLPQAIFDWLTGVIVPLPANMTQILGTAVSSPATAGILDCNVKNMNNVAGTSITAINANQGTTQPVNFTGTGATAYAKTDVVDIAGAAVSTSTAQLGVNAVQIGAAVPGSATIGTVTTLTNLPAAGATAAELAKVPKSDSTVTWNATALASINAEVDTALNTAIPGSPTADSVNQRVAAIDDLVQASGSGDLAAIKTTIGTAGAGLTAVALSSASRDAIWDQASAITLTFEQLLTRAYEMISHKMNVTDATGVVSLLGTDNTTPIATGSVTDNSVTTTRAELTWL